jgi:Protein of unknown function (DUF2500).
MPNPILLYLLVMAPFIIYGIFHWIKNNLSPKLTVPAILVSKRISVNRRYHGNPMGGANGTGNQQISFPPAYYATFQLESGDRIEFTVPVTVYGVIAEGDIGKVTYQGTRFKGFDRSI